MIPYILHVTVITTVCFLFYKLLLQKETFYRLNRWMLLGVLPFRLHCLCCRLPMIGAFGIPGLRLLITGGATGGGKSGTGEDGGHDQ